MKHCFAWQAIKNCYNGISIPLGWFVIKADMLSNNKLLDSNTLLIEWSKYETIFCMASYQNCHYGISIPLGWFVTKADLRSNSENFNANTLVIWWSKYETNFTSVSCLCVCICVKGGWQLYLLAPPHMVSGAYQIT